MRFKLLPLFLIALLPFHSCMTQRILPDTKEEQEMEREQQRVTDKMIRIEQMSAAEPGKTDSLATPKNSIAGDSIATDKPVKKKARQGQPKH